MKVVNENEPVWVSNGEHVEGFVFNLGGLHHEGNTYSHCNAWPEINCALEKLLWSSGD